jgi:hypothetical protein
LLNSRAPNEFRKSNRFKKAFGQALGDEKQAEEDLGVPT